MITPAIILGLLLLPVVLLSAVGKLTRRDIFDLQTRGCIGVAMVFCFTGIGHFIMTGPMAEMLPPWVPAREFLVYASGVMELAAAAAILVPRLRGVAGWAIAIMLVGFLPVNIYAAVNQVGMGGHQWGPVYLVIRVPLQAIILGWAWWFAVRPTANVPIEFTCTANIEQTTSQIAEQILDLDNWTEFQGYGPLPGIEKAEYERKTSDVVGSRIRVQNLDGSSHTEEIIVWVPDRHFKMQLKEFGPPLSLLASSFEETWEFSGEGGTTRAVRSLEMYPKAALTRPLLWLISILLKQAIARHLEQMGTRATVATDAS